MSNQEVTTVRGEIFSYDDHKLMAALIFRRLGRHEQAFCNAWRLLLNNETEDSEIMKLIPYPERVYSAPDGRKLTYFEASRSPCTHCYPCPSCAVGSDDFH